MSTIRRPNVTAFVMALGSIGKVWPVPQCLVTALVKHAYAGGQDLNADLRQLHQRHGQDHILLEIGFPADYPTQPFTLRIVSPRCKCAGSMLALLCITFVRTDAVFGSNSSTGTSSLATLSTLRGLVFFDFVEPPL